MKKIGFLVSVVLLTALMTKVYAQKDRTLTNGLSVNVIAGFPSSSFGSDANVGSEHAYGTIWGFQIGNRWYFAPQEKFGFGLMVNWVDFAMGLKTGTEPIALGQSFNWARTTMDVTFCEFGPVGTFAINNNIAIDGYYNLRPTVIATGYSSTDPRGDETIAYGGFGLSNTLGAALRWRVVNVGVEYVFGSINSKGTYKGPVGDHDLDDMKQSTNSVRLILGVKF